MKTDPLLVLSAERILKKSPTPIRTPFRVIGTGILVLDYSRDVLWIMSERFDRWIQPDIYTFQGP